MVPGRFGLSHGPLRGRPLLVGGAHPGRSRPLGSPAGVDGLPTTQLYPTSEGSPYEAFDPTSEITWGQLQVLSELVDEQGDGWQGVIVATERALQPHLLPPAVLADQCLTLRKGASIDLEELAANLARLGYERESPTIEQEWAAGAVAATLSICSRSALNCQCDWSSSAKTSRSCGSLIPPPSARWMLLIWCASHPPAMGPWWLMPSGPTSPIS